MMYALNLSLHSSGLSLQFFVCLVLVLNEFTVTASKVGQQFLQRADDMTTRVDLPSNPDGNGKHMKTLLPNARTGSIQ